MVITVASLENIQRRLLLMVLKLHQSCNEVSVYFRTAKVSHETSFLFLKHISAETAKNSHYHSD